MVADLRIFVVGIVAAKHTIDAGLLPFDAEVGVITITLHAQGRLGSTVGRRWIAVVINAIAKLEFLGVRVTTNNHAAFASGRTLFAKIRVVAVTRNTHQGISGAVWCRWIAIVIDAIAQVDERIGRIDTNDGSSFTGGLSIFTGVYIVTIAEDANAHITRTVQCVGVAVVIFAITDVGNGIYVIIAGQLTCLADEESVLTKVVIIAIADSAETWVVRAIDCRWVAIVIDAVA